jgi:outer membrane protein
MKIFNLMLSTISTHFRKAIFLLILIGSSTISQAQTPAQKVGYADVDYILSQLPVMKQVETDFRSMETQYKTQVDSKTAELKRKYDAYMAEGKNMLEAVRANTERELQMLNENLEKLKQDAQTALQNKQVQLMQPVYKSVGDAITAVAKENEFTFILSQQVSSLDVLLYSDEKFDVSDLVLKKLGVTPKPPATNTAAPVKETPKKQ